MQNSVQELVSKSRRVPRHFSSFGEYQFSLPAFRELTSDVLVTEVLRKWAYVAAELISIDFTKYDEYVTTAIECLTKCVQSSAQFPDVVQLLNIFFEHAGRGDIFAKTAPFIKNIPTKFLLQTSPQLLIQLSLQTKKISEFVHDIVLDLLKNHYHALIFSVIVMQDSVSERRKNEATKILEEFARCMPENAKEVTMIREALLRAAVTWYDMVMQLLEDIADYLSNEKYKEAYETLLKIKDYIREPKCQLEFTFNKQFSALIEQMDQLINTFNPKTQFMLNNFKAWTNSFLIAVGNVAINIKYIQLQTISVPLCEKTHFQLAVPGTYKPGRDIIRIEYFVQQLSVYASKQQPKSFVLKGEDGNLYQYLLKGHEDLRLDERIMQFFHLVNSILKKERPNKSLLIQTMVVMPISVLNGLVQWVPGTDTIKNIVETYRNLKKKNVNEEFNLMVNEYGHRFYDNMMPIQKMQIIKKIFNEVPDTDIANFFWLKATDAEHWPKMTNTFAISTAANSVIGYVIGSEVICKHIHF